MSLNGTVWVPIGPSPMNEGGTQDNGLVSSIAASPSNPNVIYVGTAGGGAWRSDDGGTTWTPIFDEQAWLGVGEPGGLAVDPSNSAIVYLGTSARLTAFFPLGLRPPGGFGLFKSTDGGSSWILLGSGYPSSNVGNAAGQFANQNINVVIVDPANGNNLYLASNNGVFVSTNGGLDWNPGAGAVGDARSLVLDSSANPRILYTGISGQGVFQSNDGGLNWAPVLSGATPAVAAAVGGGGFFKVVVDLAPPTAVPNPAGVQVIYVSLEGTGGAPDPVGLFLSTDQGGTWAKQAGTPPPGTQGGYSFHFAVDPASPGDGVNDILCFGTVNFARSVDSGITFLPLPVPHPDCHAWAFSRQPSPTPSIIYSGNDGGIFRSTDAGVTWTSRNGGGLQTALFYNLDIRADATGSVTVGAAQDNALQTNAGAVPPAWKALGGDGWDAEYDGGGASSQVYGSDGFYPAPPNTRISLSTDDGQSYPTFINPPFAGAENTPGVVLYPVTTDPSTAGIVYVSGVLNLWQSRSSGAPGSWRILNTPPGSFAGLNQNVDVAPANGNNVVIAVGNQVFLSTNALATTVGPPTGVTFTNITRNLPGRNVARVAFDPNDPTVIYAVVGGFNSPGNVGHVFRTSVGALAWTDISPTVLSPPPLPQPLPLDVPFNAIALDGTDTPTAIYVGCDLGVLRSVDGGASWSILDDLRFPRVPVADLVLKNGNLRAATYGRGVFAFTNPAGAAIAVSLQHGLAFGTLCQGPQYLTLEVSNVGATDLVITSVQRLIGSTGFTVLATPGTPLVLAAGEEIEFTVAFTPTTPGLAETATIRIISNDPVAPIVDLLATGMQGTSALATAIADSGDLGKACLGSFAETELTLNNVGTCPLSIFNIASSSPEFMPPGVAYPLVINPGGSLDVPIQFQPTSFGAKNATITISSDDPASPQTLAVSGVAPAPRLTLVFADNGHFGNVCVDSFLDKPLTLNNSGRCTLSITGITPSVGDFIAPQVLSYPIAIGAGDSLEVPIRFQPTSLGGKSGTITIASDDPASPATITVFGNAPAGKLAVTGSTSFGGVTACCCADRTISICNVGDCKLHVKGVAFKRKSRHWKLLNNPFPATLHPGSCLSVVIRYKASEKCARCCELVISSDDPVTPVKVLDVLAYTIWNECGCQKCCDDCRKGCCEKHHAESCSQGYPCCDDDDEIEDED